MAKTDNNSPLKDNLNSHKFVYAFAFIFILLSLIWIIGLSGAQTGSSTVMGAGSILSINPTDDPDPTYEVVVEGLVFIFVFIGVAMGVYYYTKSKIADDLISKGYLSAGLEVDGKKDINKETEMMAKREEISKLSSQIGMPPPMGPPMQPMGPPMQPMGPPMPPMPPKK